MPARNSIKQYDAPSYYHVYNRGAGKRPIFLDDQDRRKFISLLARHLDPDDTSVRADGKIYEKYEVELVAYCLMDNHFHFLLYQESDITAITQLMRSITVAYTMYFNLRYGQQGHLFQGVFKASRIDNHSYLAHITRYIHLNPRSYKRYKWSSLSVYLGKHQETWLHPERVLDMTPTQYLTFLEDYESRKAILGEIKDQLAI